MSSQFNIMWNMFRNDDSVFEYKTNQHAFSIFYSYEYHVCDCGFYINWKLKSDHDFYRIDSDQNIIVDSQEGYQLFNSTVFKKFPKIQSSIHFGIKNILDVTEVKDSRQENTHSGPFSIISWGVSSYFQLRAREHIHTRLLLKD